MRDDDVMFKVGDTVRAKRRYPDCPRIGAVGTVVDTYMDHGTDWRRMEYTVDYGYQGYRDNICYNGDIELVRDPEKTVPTVPVPQAT